jgi:beta-galactosidase GanA
MRTFLGASAGTMAAISQSSICLRSNRVAALSGVCRVCLVSVWISVVCVEAAYPQSASAIPHLRKHGTATQLIVHDKPLLMLGGELGNSSASDLKYMAPVWPKLKAMHLNTVLMPVYWELIEPREGDLDFALVDTLIQGAREQDLKIVVLWFGSWKNSMSCYVPSWIKTNQQRFPRSRTQDGRAIEILTPFSDQNRDADAKVFAAFMRHLHAIDGKANTVVMIQVENEIGMIPQARDYCPEAEKSFAQRVPAELIAYLHKHRDSLTEELRQAWSAAGGKSAGTWEEVFGKGLATDEIFMAWHFGRFTDYVAQAGKKEYPLPMYVNAALIRPHYTPGQYPSAGPLPHLMNVWKAAAPNIDFLAPDIYFKNFAEWLGKFDRDGNAMFVPEVDHRQSVSNAFYAVARHNSMGYSPFAIESADNPANNQFNRGYAILHQLTPLILEHQGTGTLTGFLLDSAAQTAEIRLGDYIFSVKHEYTWPYAARAEGDTPRFGGLIVMTREDEFYIAGTGVVVTFTPSSVDGTIAGIASVDEGTFVKGKWVAGRRMNGDQTHQGRHVHLPGGEYGIQKVRLYKYR